jgi:hypothetical protein
VLNSGKVSSLKAGVPNLWLKVVLRKLEIYFLTKKYASLPMGLTMVVRRNVFCLFCGTWKFVLLIWWYAAEKRLGTPALKHIHFFVRLG